MKDFVKIPEKRKKLLMKDKEGIKKLENLTNTKIVIDEDVLIEGESVEVFQTKNILKAFGRGFSLDDSLYLLDDGYGLEIIDLTEFTRSRNRLKVLKGRIIGTGGKTKKTIERYTDTKISVLGKTISILGKWDKINVSREAIMKLVRGCTHRTLYRWLEQQYPKVTGW